MKETTQQYMQRILGYSEGRDPLKVQASTPARLQKLVKPLNKRDVSTRPAPDKWSIQEIVAHLAECELVAGWRIRVPGQEAFTSGLDPFAFAFR